MAAKALIGVSCLLLTCLCTACGPVTSAATSTPPAVATPPAAAAAAPAGTATVQRSATARPIAAADPTSRCPQYSAATYGIDPNQVADTGGGAQLVTVVAPSTASLAGTFRAWAKGTSGCWSPGVFAGQPAQPVPAQARPRGLL